MRRIAVQLEALDAVRFVLVIALAAGAIQGVPQFFLGGTVTPLQVISFLIVGATGVLWWTGALLLWWVAVRRRQSSIWIVATQITLGLIIGEIFAGALGMVVASIDTHGKVAMALAQNVSTVVVSSLTFPLLRSPLWFAGAALAIALGRHLNGGPTHLPTATSAAGDQGGVSQ